MKITQLNDEKNGTRSVEIRANELSYRALLRCIHRIPEAEIMEKAHDPMNDNTKIDIRYKDVILTIDTPFSDYIINCTSPSKSFDEFISLLSSHQLKWWERIF